MFELRQNIFTLFLLLCLLSCSSNPKPPIEPQNNTFISKPEVTFNLKSLPKQINVFYFNSSVDGQNSSPLLKGITDNYYYYKKRIGYTPELNFIDFSDNVNCKENITLLRKSFSIGLFLNQDYSQLGNSCYERFIETKGLVVSNDKIQGIRDQIFRTFSINREADISSLLNIARNNGDQRAIIIDDSTTRDKTLLEKTWKNMDGEVVYSISSEKGISSQKLLSKILLLDQSNIRSRKLSRIIGLQINSKPRRREDIDSIFLSTSLSNARSLKPALEYNFADNISVYLIPSWRGREYLKESELDLENVIISEIPFLLNTKISFQETNPANKSRNYAIGYDTFELVLLLSANPRRNFNYFGLTGLITNEYPIIKKEVLSARVVNGKLKYLDYTD